MIQNPTLIGPQLPALTNPGTAADLAQGKELIGADGEVVTGAVNVVENGEFGMINSPLQHAPESTSVEPFAPGAPLFEVRGTSVSGSTIFRPGAVAKIYGRPKIFGDATAADVAKGKTFTSTAGVKVAGTGRVLSYGWKESSLPKLDTKQSGADILLLANTTMQQLTLFINHGNPYLTFTDKAGTSFAIPFSINYSNATVAQVSNGTVFKPLLISVTNRGAVSAVVDEGRETVTNFIPSGEIALSHGYFTPPSA